MADLKPGQPAPLFSLASTQGQEIALADVLQGGEQALLVFLRHLG